ncbi:hypothetical protein LXL04_017607 [Taraxacum kok-saghyz]
MFFPYSKLEESWDYHKLRFLGKEQDQWQDYNVRCPKCSNKGVYYHTQQVYSISTQFLWPNASRTYTVQV